MDCNSQIRAKLVKIESAGMERGARGTGRAARLTKRSPESPAACSGAVADGGARRQPAPEGEEDGGRVLEDQELTVVLLVESRRPESARRRRI